MFQTKNVVDFLQDCGFIKKDINRLCLEPKIILNEPNEDYLDYIEN